MAHTLATYPQIYYAPPSKPRALYYGPAHLIETARKFIQGAGTALLAYMGAGKMANASVAGASTISDIMTIDGLTQAVAEGRLTGPAQLAAALFLFLAAGRCVARMVGLAAGLAVIYLYTEGHTLAEGLSILKAIADRLAAAISAFQDAGA